MELIWQQPSWKICYASASGTILVSSIQQKRLWNQLFIKHRFGLKLLWTSKQGACPKRADYKDSKEIIGTVGSTGSSTG